MPAMLVLKQTPQGVRLLPLKEVTGSRGKPMDRFHPQAQRVQEVMDYMMVKLRPIIQSGKRITLAELWSALTQQYGPDYFSDVVLLPSVRDTPARLLFKEGK